MTFKDNIPFSREGTGVDAIWFSGGRLGASIGRHGGITDVVYFGGQPLGRQHFFSTDKISTFGKLFRLAVIIGKAAYYPEFNRTEFYPFGYTSEFAVEGVKFSHQLVLLNDTLIQRVKILANPGKKRVALKMITLGNPARVNMPHRTWNDFAVDGKRGWWSKATDAPPQTKGSCNVADVHKNLSFKDCTDTDAADTFIYVSADKPVRCSNSTNRFKYWMETEPFADSASVFVTFGSDGKAVRKRVEYLRRSAGMESDRKIRSYHDRCLELPAINIGDECVQSFLMNEPLMIDALKVEDLPGGMRASAGHYWIWGWDSMVHSDAVLFANDRKFIRDMLDFYRNLADERLGIPHQVTMRMKPRLAMEFPAQCLYIVMLYNYCCFTGDMKTVKRHLDFAFWIISKNMENNVAGTGLNKGTSLFPDTPQHAGHDGNDISVFNNSIYYQALKAMIGLAKIAGGEVRNEKYRKLIPLLPGLAEQVRENFIRYFFDMEAGYFVDSVSSIDFKRRKHYPLYAILWITEFAGDLVQGIEKKTAGFMEKNFTAPHGLYPYPRWDSCFGGDGNQMQAYYPVIDPFYYNMMRLTGNKSGLERMCQNIGWFWKTHTIPEGFTYDAENEGIGVDNPGCNQAFGGHAWYANFFHAACGINIDLEGISFSPSNPGTDIAVEAMEIRGMKLDIRITGKGWKIKRLLLNGKDTGAPFKIPFTALRKQNRIELTRGS
ncbi:MAG: hypothetical protein WAX69_12150 [Victivallales bacterium]